MGLEPTTFLCHGFTDRLLHQFAYPPMVTVFYLFPRENRQTEGSHWVMTPIDIHSWMTNPLGLGAEPLKDSRTYLTPLLVSRVPSHFR